MHDEGKLIDRKVLRRCETIIRMFMDTPDPPQDLVDRFHAWLLDGRRCTEKDIAMRRVFDERVTMKLMSADQRVDKGGTRAS